MNKRGDFSTKVFYISLAVIFIIFMFMKLPDKTSFFKRNILMPIKRFDFDRLFTGKIRFSTEPVTNIENTKLLNHYLNNNGELCFTIMKKDIEKDGEKCNEIIYYEGKDFSSFYYPTGKVTGKISEFYINRSLYENDSYILPNLIRMISHRNEFYAIFSPIGTSPKIFGRNGFEITLDEIKREENSYIDFLISKDRKDIYYIVKRVDKKDQPEKDELYYNHKKILEADAILFSPFTDYSYEQDILEIGSFRNFDNGYLFVKSSINGEYEFLLYYKGEVTKRFRDCVIDKITTTPDNQNISYTVSRDTYNERHNKKSNHNNNEIYGVYINQKKISDKGFAAFFNKKDYYLIKAKDHSNYDIYLNGKQFKETYSLDYSKENYKGEMEFYSNNRIIMIKENGDIFYKKDKKNSFDTPQKINGKNFYYGYKPTEHKSRSHGVAWFGYSVSNEISYNYKYFINNSKLSSEYRPESDFYYSETERCFVCLAVNNAKSYYENFGKTKRYTKTPQYHIFKFWVDEMKK